MDEGRLHSRGSKEARLRRAGAGDEVRTGGFHGLLFKHAEHERGMRQGKKKGKKEVARGDLTRASVVCSSELAGARAATGEERRAEELGLLQDLGGDGGWTGGENEEKVEASFGSRWGEWRRRGDGWDISPRN